MRKLSDYQGEGGDWLPVGWHDVTVEKHECIVNPKDGKNTPGVTFHLQSKERKQKLTFWLTDASIWRLANFVKACGLPEDAFERYDVDNPNSHSVLVGKSVAIEVITDPRNSKYTTVENFMAVGETKPPIQTVPVQGHPSPQTASSNKEDVPF